MKKIQGFSLLEILVGLIILALALTAGFVAMSRNTQTVNALITRSAANWLALNISSELTLGIKDLQTYSVPQKYHILNKTLWVSARLFSNNQYYQSIVIHISEQPNNKQVRTFYAYLDNKAS